MQMGAAQEAGDGNYVFTHQVTDEGYALPAGLNLWHAVNTCVERVVLRGSATTN